MKTIAIINSSVDWRPWFQVRSQTTQKSNVMQKNIPHPLSSHSPETFEKIFVSLFLLFFSMTTTGCSKLSPPALAQRPSPRRPLNAKPPKIKEHPTCQKLFSQKEIHRFFQRIYSPRPKSPIPVRYAYVVGPLRLRSWRLDCRFDLRDFQKAVMKALPQSACQSSTHRRLLRHLKKVVSQKGFTQPLQRQKSTPAFTLERLKYLLYALSLHASDHKKKAGFGKPPQVLPCPAKQRTRYQFAIIPFRKHDLDRICKSTVDQGIALGFDRVTLFYPIPVASHRLSAFRCSSETKETCKPIHGKDYLFETAGTIERPELYRCLDYIFQSRLKLNFVPHLESIITLNTTHEAEMRVNLAVPLDQRYYRRAYQDLFRYLQKHKKKYDIKYLRLSAAAEMDPMFLSQTKESLALVQRLRKEVRRLGLKGEITWNPFNNFEPMEDANLHNLHCPTLGHLLRQLDAFAPSLYEEYQNVPLRGRQTFSAMRQKFQDELLKMLASLCPRDAASWSPWLKKKTFLLGEFALSSGRILYDDFHQQMRKDSPSSDAIFWNTGSWNHLFWASPPTSPTTRALHQSLMKSLAPCRSKQKHK